MNKMYPKHPHYDPINPFITFPSTSSPPLHPILDSLDHLPTQLGCLVKPRREEIRRLLKSPSVPIKVAYVYTFTPSPGSDDKLDVVRTVDAVGERGAEGGRKESRRAEKVLGDTYVLSAKIKINSDSRNKKTYQSRA